MRNSGPPGTMVRSCYLSWSIGIPKGKTCARNTRTFGGMFRWMKAFLILLYRRVGVSTELGLNRRNMPMPGSLPASPCR